MHGVGFGEEGGVVSSSQTVLLATLGTAPQVVTAALHLLRRRREAIAQVDVFCTHAPRIQAARERLKATFAQYPRWPPLTFVSLLDAQGRPLVDVVTKDDAQAAFRAIYRHLREHKRHGRRVHFLIAGGRKPLALYGMATAQLLFDEDDALWHLYSAPAFLESRRMLPGPQDEVALVPLPVILWPRLAPALAFEDEDADPWAAVAWARRLARDERLAQARRFFHQYLSPAEQRVVAALVLDGLSDQELAQRLHLSERTVGNHLSRVYDKVASFWGLERVSRVHLVALLGVYLRIRDFSSRPPDAAAA